MYVCTQCQENTRFTYAGQCANCFNHEQLGVVVSNIPKNAVESDTGDIKARNELNKIINKAIDDVEVKMDRTAYTKEELQVYLDMFKTKIKGNIARKIRIL